MLLVSIVTFFRRCFLFENVHIDNIILQNITSAWYLNARTSAAWPPDRYGGHPDAHHHASNERPVRCWKNQQTYCTRYGTVMTIWLSANRCKVELACWDSVGGEPNMDEETVWRPPCRRAPSNPNPESIIASPPAPPPLLPDISLNEDVAWSRMPESIRWQVRRSTFMMSCCWLAEAQPPKPLTRSTAALVWSSTFILTCRARVALTRPKRWRVETCDGAVATDTASACSKRWLLNKYSSSVVGCLSPKVPSATLPMPNPKGSLSLLPLARKKESGSEGDGSGSGDAIP